MPLGLATDHPRRHVRLDTLVRLRWLAVIGQSTAVLVVQYALEFEFPFVACLVVIALSAALNIGIRLRFQTTQWLTPMQTASLLAFDVAELAALLLLTGGLQNPFAFLFLAPVLSRRRRCHRATRWRSAASPRCARPRSSFFIIRCRGTPRTS
jgi:two-component system sensor histidine kinase RegB